MLTKYTTLKKGISKCESSQILTLSTQLLTVIKVFTMIELHTEKYNCLLPMCIPLKSPNYPCFNSLYFICLQCPCYSSLAEIFPVTVLICNTMLHTLLSNLCCTLLYQSFVGLVESYYISISEIGNESFLYHRQDINRT